MLVRFQPDLSAEEAVKGGLKWFSTSLQRTQTISSLG